MRLIFCSLFFPIICFGLDLKTLNIEPSKKFPPFFENPTQNLLKKYWTKVPSQKNLDLQNSKIRNGVGPYSPTSEAPALAKNILAKLLSPPISQLDITHQSYKQRIGFCFGRALTAHWLLIKAGVKQHNMAKIFALGPIIFKSTVWEYHMATMFRAENGSWWILDPLYHTPLQVRVWMDKVEKLSSKKKNPRMAFYVTDPRKFRPDTVFYREKDFQDPLMAPYFAELKKLLP